MISTKGMKWNTETRILSAYVSEVGGWYPEFFLVSHITCKKVGVTLVDDKHDANHGRLWCDYRPFGVDKDIDMTFRVFNE